MTPTELKALRAELGLTQAELAAHLRISRDAVAKLENGKNKMSKPVAELARQLAEGATDSGNL